MRQAGTGAAGAGNGADLTKELGWCNRPGNWRNMKAPVPTVSEPLRQPPTLPARNQPPGRLNAAVLGSAAVIVIQALRVDGPRSRLHPTVTPITCSATATWRRSPRSYTGHGRV
jgi:hypothetical protein